MNNSSAGGVFDIELPDVEEATEAGNLDQSDDDSIELDEVSRKKKVDSVPSGLSWCGYLVKELLKLREVSRTRDAE